MPREDRTKHRRIDPKKDLKLRDEVIVKPSRSMMVDTTTSAYGDAGRGRPVPKNGKFETRPPTKKSEPRKNQKKLPPKENNYGQFSKGGEVCRGAGAAIKGTKFEGIF